MTEVDNIVKQAADYVAATQPKLDAFENKEASFRAQAVKTAAVLANRGALESDKVDAFAEKLAGDHTYALTYLERLANAVSADSLGHSAPAIAKTASVKADPFQAILMPETVR